MPEGNEESDRASKNNDDEVDFGPVVMKSKEMPEEIPINYGFLTIYIITVSIGTFQTAWSLTGNTTTA